MSLTPIALVYGSSTCYTEMTAEKIRDYLGADRVTLQAIGEGLSIEGFDYERLYDDFDLVA